MLIFVIIFLNKCLCVAKFEHFIIVYIGSLKSLWFCDACQHKWKCFNSLALIALHCVHCVQNPIKTRIVIAHIIIDFVHTRVLQLQKFISLSTHIDTKQVPLRTWCRESVLKQHENFPNRWKEFRPFGHELTWTAFEWAISDIVFILQFGSVLCQFLFLFQGQYFYRIHIEHFCDHNDIYGLDRLHCYASPKAANVSTDRWDRGIRCW